jgi:tetratricopeptide (TPR) repeat protein
MISAVRRTDAASLSRFVRGDVDWIVMKALEKDRTRRYETAAGLAADIERFLQGDLVEACPPSAAYKFRKFARRNRGLLAAAAVIAIVLVVTSVVSTSLAVSAFRAADRVQIQTGLERTAEVVKQRPGNAILAFQLAQLYAWFNREEERVALIKKYLSLATESGDPVAWNSAAKSYLIRPTGEPAMAAQAVSLARRSAQSNQPGPIMRWHELVCGMAEYRETNYEQAEDWLTKAQSSSEPELRGTALLFRAMCRYARGHTAAATADFKEAEAIMPPLPDRNRLTPAMVLDAIRIVFWLAYEEARELLVRGNREE